MRAPQIFIPRFELVTVEVLYRMPDYLHLLQTFVWQTMDVRPDFPVVARFLSHWKKNVEAPIQDVRIAGKSVVTSAEWRRADTFITLH